MVLQFMQGHSSIFSYVDDHAVIHQETLGHFLVQDIVFDQEDVLPVQVALVPLLRIFQSGLRTGLTPFKARVELKREPSFLLLSR